MGQILSSWFNLLDQLYSDPFPCYNTRSFDGYIKSIISTDYSHCLLADINLATVAMGKTN